jgi:hypothetical protein
MPVAAKQKMAALKALEAELLRIVGEEPYQRESGASAAGAA